MYEQLNLLDEILPSYYINKPIRLIELFAGIGSQFMAAKRVFKDVESYKICEWAYNSFKGYNYIHIRDFHNYALGKTKEELIKLVNGVSINYNEPLSYEQLSKKSLEWLQDCYNNKVATNNLLDITNVKAEDLEIEDTDKYCYILTYSFPCQDLSKAGLRKGIENGTRSGMLYQVLRILTELQNKPQILIMENVPDLIESKFIDKFKKLENFLSSLGYSNYCEVMNGIDYNVPQKRKRVFMVSILGDYNFNFPPKVRLTKTLEDNLDNNVDKKYYLTDKMLKGKINTKFNQYKLKVQRNVSDCITTGTGEKHPLTIPINNKTKKGYTLAEVGDGIDISSRMEHHRGTVQKKCSQTLTTSCDIGVIDDKKI